MAPLLLLSGLLCDETIWTDVSTRLVTGGDVYIRCFPSFDSIASMAEHVLNTAPPTFAVAGHSLGGRIALEVVRRAPTRIIGLALLNTGIHPRRAHEWAARGRLVELGRNSGMTAVATEWLPPMMGASPTRVAEVMPKLIRMVESNTPESFAAQTRALLERPDASSVLPMIGVPTLLMSGTADTWSPLAQHEEMRRHIRRAQLVPVAEAGHMAPVEQPELVAAALDTWRNQL